MIKRVIREYYVRNMSRIQLMTSMKRTSPTIQLKCIDLEDNEEYQKLINGEIDQQTMVY